jgi:SAM-dependent methyltransferase
MTSSSRAVASPVDAEDRARAVYRGAAGNTYFKTLDGDAFTQAVVARERARKVQPHVRSDDRVLEYGVGGGYNLRFVRCRERWGYDLNEAGRDACVDAGIRFVTDPGALTPASFDVVVCHHVLEHVPDPMRTIQELETLARPGGTVLIFVPFETRRRYREHRPDDPNHHLFSWNVQSLGNLLSRSGLHLDTIGVRAFSYERRLAPLARLGTGAYRLGLTVLRRLRREDELFARLTRPVPEVVARIGAPPRPARAA